MGASVVALTTCHEGVDHRFIVIADDKSEPKTVFNAILDWRNDPDIPFNVEQACQMIRSMSRQMMRRSD